ncbi:hypothetical protein [Cohnella sp. GCM10012308]|uniref:hypothetical protein n=1 Tax=Cohnella sp. GCM10012308 TaxID=3317329 RepID=UPI0036161641
MPRFKTSTPRANGRAKHDHITADIIRQLQAENLTITAMADRLEIPRGTMSWLLAKHKLSGTSKGVMWKRGPRPKKQPVERPHEEINEPIIFPPLTPDITKLMHKFYPTMPRTALAKQLGIPKTQLIHYAIQLGLKSGGVCLELVGEDDA